MMTQSNAMSNVPERLHSLSLCGVLFGQITIAKLLRSLGRRFVGRGVRSRLAE